MRDIDLDPTPEYENRHQADLARRERVSERIMQAINDANTQEIIEVVATRHYLGPWGLVELLLDHGAGLIRAEWERVTPDGAPEPPDEYFMAIQLHLTPRYARAIIVNAGDTGRALLVEHADELLRGHYEKEVT